MDTKYITLISNDTGSMHTYGKFKDTYEKAEADAKRFAVDHRYNSYDIGIYTLTSYAKVPTPDIEIVKLS